MGEGDGQRGQEEDQKADDVDNAEDDDGEVLSEVLVGNDGSEDGGDCASQLEVIRGNMYNAVVP